MEAGGVAVVVHQDQVGAQPRALVEELRNRGQHAEVISVRELAVEVHGGLCQVLHRGEGFLPSAVVTQGLNRSWAFMEQLLAVLEDQGVVVVNPVAASSLALDKLATARRLADAGIPVLAMRAQTWGASAAAPPSFPEPLVSKPARGSNGAGILAHGTWSAASAHLSKDRELGPDGLVGVELVQPRATGAGVDVRVLVVSGKPLVCVKRRARHGIVAGWKDSEVEAYASEDAEAIATAAVERLGLAYGAVDLVEHEGELLVLEVNCWPRDLEAMGEVAGARTLEVVVDLVATRPS